MSPGGRLSDASGLLCSALPHAPAPAPKPPGVSGFLLFGLCPGVESREVLVCPPEEAPAEVANVGVGQTSALEVPLEADFRSVDGTAHVHHGPALLVLRVLPAKPAPLTDCPIGEPDHVNAVSWLVVRHDGLPVEGVGSAADGGRLALYPYKSRAQASGNFATTGRTPGLQGRIRGPNLHSRLCTRGHRRAGADVSALDHLLAAETTISSDRGLFLSHTRRLHPEICAFTSELFYRGRLRSRPELERQSVRGPDPFDGSGLRFVPVRHAGNQNESLEEAEVVSELIRQLLDAGSTWIDEDGAEKPLGLEDILIVAPYNAQVAMLSDALRDGASVGTVDKFQGQEAPIVIYSMTTSSADEAPRGMSFLYSSNRVNVATSRARCVAMVVGSPELFAPKCRSPRQMKLANTFCRFREMAEVFEAS